MALTHHIENLRAKPEHIRERIAFGTAAGITGLVALVWVTTLAATGTFSLAPAGGTLASGDQNGSPSADQSANTPAPTNFSQLVGAAGAALGATSSDPEIHIVDNGTKSSIPDTSAPAANNSDATVIPF
jgi:hypothetical protein